MHHLHVVRGCAVCRASAKELHTTLIRNEAAYFGCVLQLLRDHPPPQALPPGCSSSDSGPDTGMAPGGHTAAGARPLFLCGDSHCLSGAAGRANQSNRLIDGSNL